jgi:hypothetical protein
MKKRLLRGLFKTFSALFTNTAIVLLFIGTVIPKEVLIVEISVAILCIITSIIFEAYLEKE